MTKYALFTYSTSNIGDDIQSLAAKRFLPEVDYYINRDYMTDFRPETDEPIKLIMNGWYSHRPQHFPPQIANLDPLLISAYIDDSVKAAFSRPEMIAFFRQFGPVGARSKDTEAFLEDLGIDHYLSACLTLTLKPEPHIPKQDFILAIDLPNAVFDKVEREAHLPVIRMGVDIAHRYMTPTRRLKLAQYYLYLYQSARFVITTRLHGTLPCLALGTPVLNIEQPGFEPGRFEGLRELANHMTAEAFLAGNYDVNNPLPNTDAYLPLQQELESRVQAFTGFKSNQGFLDGMAIQDFLRDPELIQSIVTGLWTGCQFYGVTR